jgi:hypothetical protein
MSAETVLRVKRHARSHSWQQQYVATAPAPATPQPPPPPTKPVSPSPSTSETKVSAAAAPGKRAAASSSPHSSSAEEYVKVKGKVSLSQKRKHKKSCKLSTAGSTPPLLTANRFEALSDSSDMDAESAASDSDSSSSSSAVSMARTPARQVRVPAIVFKMIMPYGQIVKKLDALVSDTDYTVKVTGELYKLNLKNPADYNTVTNTFASEGVEYHTYALSKTNGQRFVIRGLPKTTDPTDIAAELTALGFATKIVVQLGFTRDGVRTQYALFAATLEATPGKPPVDLSTITRLQRCVVTTEAPLFNRGPGQCHRCQRVGHATAFCRRAMNCVRCSGAHLVADCPAPRGDDAVLKCCNCGGNHVASYRGCSYLLRAKEASTARPHNTTGWTQQASTTVTATTQPPPPATATRRPQMPTPMPRQRPTMRPRLEWPPLKPQNISYAHAIQGGPAPAIQGKQTASHQIQAIQNGPQNIPAIQGNNNPNAIQGKQNIISADHGTSTSSADPGTTTVDVDLTAVLQQISAAMVLISQQLAVLTSTLTAVITKQNASTP